MQKAILQALVALRAGDMQAAVEAAEAAEAIRPVVSGTANGIAFDDFRDADDLCSGSLEVLTTTGKYFWIPVERVVSMEFHAPKRPRDLFWRRCTMSVREGPDGDIYLPVLYATTGADDSLRLGRSTAWSDTMPIRGSGQRVFLIGEEGMSVSQLQTVEFA
jgi:type VI secretion system protein ImpE